jgi:polynucleotide 5'-kinase involved in rRNA processing
MKMMKKKKIKKEEPENDNKIEKKQKTQNNENKLTDNENDENKKEKNKNNKDFKKSENNKEKETDISLYRYPSNFEIINKSSSLLKDIREINIVLIGEKQSGKSSFVIKITENNYFVFH